jgi:hypothetical protein
MESMRRRGLRSRLLRYRPSASRKARQSAIFALFLCAFLAMPYGVRANYVDITVTGTVYSGTDTSGMFVGTGANLAGQDFTAIFTFDDTKGTQGSSPTTSYIETSGSSNPGIVELDIGNGTFIGGRGADANSKASVVYNGIPSDSEYGLLDGDGSYPGGSSTEGFVYPASGTELTTSANWETASPIPISGQALTASPFASTRTRRKRRAATSRPRA